jgi:hypothetical protein
VVNPVCHLANHSDFLHCVDRGQRGELVAALILMQARDKASQSMGGTRWVSVSTFMEALLPIKQHEALQRGNLTS